jgi:hypothetical protein
LPRAVEDAHDFDAGFDWSIKDYIIADREHPEVRAHIRSRHSKAWRFAKISTAKVCVVSAVKLSNLAHAHFEPATTQRNHTSKPHAAIITTAAGFAAHQSFARST